MSKALQPASRGGLFGPEFACAGFQFDEVNNTMVRGNGEVGFAYGPACAVCGCAAENEPFLLAAIFDHLCAESFFTRFAARAPW